VKRGRPPEKSFPAPRTVEQGIDTAVYGKIGASEGMAFVRDCPCATIEHIKKKPAKERSRAEKEFLKRAPEFTEKWAIRIGSLLGRKIVTGDGQFFRDVASAAEECCKESHPFVSIRRYLAMQYREDCWVSNTPFTSKGLREYYRLNNPGEAIDSRTLSRMMKWAQSAEP